MLDSTRRRWTPAGILTGCLVLFSLQASVATAAEPTPPTVWFKFCPSVSWDQPLGGIRSTGARATDPVACTASGWSGSAENPAPPGPAGYITTSGSISGTSVTGTVQGLVDYTTNCFACSEFWDFGGTVEVYVQACYAGSSGGTYGATGTLRATQFNACGATGPYIAATWGAQSAGSSSDCSNAGTVQVSQGFSFQDAQGPIVENPDYPDVPYRRIGSIPLSGGMSYGDGFHFSPHHWQLQMDVSFTISVTVGAAAPGCCFALVTPPAANVPSADAPNAKYPGLSRDIHLGVQPAKAGLGIGGDCKCCEYRQFVEGTLSYFDDDAGCYFSFPPTLYGEDLPPRDSPEHPYGHREFPNSPGDTYQPDRAAGCEYSNADDPGLDQVPQGRKYHWQGVLYYMVVHRDSPDCPPMSGGPGRTIAVPFCLEGRAGVTAPVHCTGPATGCSYVANTASGEAAGSGRPGAATASPPWENATIVVSGAHSTVWFQRWPSGELFVSLSHMVSRDTLSPPDPNVDVAVSGYTLRAHDSAVANRFVHSGEKMELFRFQGVLHDTLAVTATIGGQSRSFTFVFGRGLLGVPGAETHPVLGWRIRSLDNPARGRVDLVCEVPRPGVCEVAVFDGAGRRVRTLLRSWVPAGERSVRWDAKDARGFAVPHGVYFVRIQSPVGQDTAKLTLVD